VRRVQQFASHVRARVTPDEAALAREILPASAWATFDAMPVADRRHALDVATRLVEAGHRDDELLAAALLHDAAKGDRTRLWHRVAGVLLEAGAPRLLQRLAVADPTSWRHPFWLYLHHARLSGGIAEDAGCSPRTRRLIQGDPDGADERRLLAALRVADDAS
jgi:hypothetical protein